MFTLFFLLLTLICLDFLAGLFIAGAVVWAVLDILIPPVLLVMVIVLIFKLLRR